MGGILSGASNAKQQKAVGALQFQTSQQGGVIPLVYGTPRVSPNLIDYDDFMATPSARQGGAGKGGGEGKGGGQQYKYSCLGNFGAVSRADCRHCYRMVGQEFRNAVVVAGRGLSRK